MDVEAARDDDLAGPTHRRENWTRITPARTFTGTFELAGEALKRPPGGYAADHPLVEDLKRQDFIATTSFPESQVLEDDFLEWFAGVARTGAPFVKFLANGVGVEF